LHAVAPVSSFTVPTTVPSVVGQLLQVSPVVQSWSLAQGVFGGLFPPMQIFVPMSGVPVVNLSWLGRAGVPQVQLEVLHGSGETLPDIVRAVRGLAAGGPVEDLLEDLLLASGYSDAHASRYQHDGYALRRLSATLGAEHPVVMAAGTGERLECDIEPPPT